MKPLESFFNELEKTSESFGWCYVKLPASISKKIIAYGKTISDEDLYTDEPGKGRESNPHISVKYGLHTKSGKKVKDVVEGFQGGEVQLGDIDIFIGKDGKEFDVVKVSVDSDALSELHYQISGELSNSDEHKNYRPHITIAYVKKGLGNKYKGGKEFNGMKFKFDKFYFEDKNDNKTTVPIEKMSRVTQSFFNEIEKTSKYNPSRIKFKVYKENKIPLTEEERKKVFKSNAVWHYASSKDPNTGRKVRKVSAIWKSVVNGKTTFGTNTHRAFNTASTLKGAINRFHGFIKGTA